MLVTEAVEAPARDLHVKVHDIAWALEGRSQRGHGSQENGIFHPEGLSRRCGKIKVQNIKNGGEGANSRGLSSRVITGHRCTWRWYARKAVVKRSWRRLCLWVEHDNGQCYNEWVAQANLCMSNPQSVLVVVMKIFKERAGCNRGNECLGAARRTDGARINASRRCRRKEKGDMK